MALTGEEELEDATILRDGKELHRHMRRRGLLSVGRVGVDTNLFRKTDYNHKKGSHKNRLEKHEAQMNNTRVRYEIPATDAARSAR